MVNGGGIGSGIPTAATAWDRVERELTEILSAGVYRSLLQTPAYKSFVASAQSTAGGGQLNPESCRVRAHLAILELKQADEPLETNSTLEACVITGPCYIFRLVKDAILLTRNVPKGRATNYAGNWWFPQELFVEVAKRALEIVGGGVTDLDQGRALKALLRRALAVRKHWTSDQNYLLQQYIPKGSSLPAIRGIGKPQPLVASKDRFLTYDDRNKLHRLGDGRHVPTGLLNTTLPGGDPQIWIPWCPAFPQAKKIRLDKIDLKSVLHELRV